MVSTFLVLTATLSLCSGLTHVKFQWNYVNFTWPSSEVYQKALDDGSYIPENNIAIGIKVWKDRMYLTVPRLKNGVPATLVSTPLNPTDGNISPLLEPFLNWEMQKLDDCSAFQFVQSMEIDPQGRMWILENGRTEFQTRARTKCPARLVVLDLENQNKKVLDYEFPSDVVHRNTSNVNDIVLDHEDGGHAYITDSDSEFPGVIVFSVKTKTSWKVTHETMRADKAASELRLNGTTFKVTGGVSGVTLSPASAEGDRILYYSPLESYQLFSVPVSQLKKNNLQDVTLIAQKSSQSAGMLMDSDGHLYYGLNNNDTVAVWDTHLPFEEDTYFHDRDVNQWTDTFATDANSFLYWSTTRLQRFNTNQLNINETNCRVIVSKIFARNYQYYQNLSAPHLPLLTH